MVFIFVMSRVLQGSKGSGGDCGVEVMAADVAEAPLLLGTSKTGATLQAIIIRIQFFIESSEF